MHRRLELDVEPRPRLRDRSERLTHVRRRRAEEGDDRRLSVIGQAVLVLDDNKKPAFGTSLRLVREKWIQPEQLRIVQCCDEKAADMQKHEVFGPRVVHAAVQDYLEQGDERFAGAYLDLCGTWDKQLRPALEALFARPQALPPHGSPPFVLGVTWITRDAQSQTENEVKIALNDLLQHHAVVKRLGPVRECAGMRTAFYKLWLG